MANIVWGEIKITIHPQSTGRAALIESLNAIEAVGAGPMLQAVKLDYGKRDDLFIQVAAADNWGTDLRDCATKLFEALNALPSCEDLVLRYNQFVSTEFRKER